MSKFVRVKQEYMNDVIGSLKGQKLEHVRFDVFHVIVKNMYGDEKSIPGCWIEDWRDDQKWSGYSWQDIKPTAKLQFIVAGRKSGKLRPATEPYIHLSEGEATKEANRMAEAHKGQEFVVLKEIYSVEKPPVKVWAIGEQVEITSDKTPFREGTIVTIECFLNHDSDNTSILAFGQFKKGDVGKAWVKLNKGDYKEFVSSYVPF